MGRGSLCFVLACVFALAASAGTEPTPEERLARGEILVRSEEVPGSSLPRVIASAVVDAPPERLWPIIDRCADYPRTMVRVRAAEELSRQGEVVRCRLTIDLPFPLPDLTSTTEALHTVKPGQRYERRWKLVEGPYKSNSGAWILTPFGDSGQRTLVVYEMHAEPDVFIPGWAQRLGQRKSIPQVFEKLRALMREP